ncbi:unnamed protein product, partial [Mesorhabditis belari]|uniref:Uncharacterized protein n=1 Tax=Mesorhabditis belari TaxID=2138241 RepID=A0AAF3EBG1_9BILA
MFEPGRIALHKRKNVTIDELFARKDGTTLETCRHDFAQLLQMKQDYSCRQKRSSLLVDPCRIDDAALIHLFASLYQKLSTAPMSTEEHLSQISLIKQVIKESILIEWPKAIGGLGPGGEEDYIEVDCPPLIHRARNVVKCRSSHPTIRVKVCAISQSAGLPKTVEAFFRATLVKLSSDSAESKQVAGRIILTQREGTPATRNCDHSGAVVDSDGRVVASQAASDTHSYILLERYGETNVKTSPLKFENGVLCATFPEMGVALNSMIDRRQLATRYAIQVEVGLNIDNKLIVEHTLHSHPFLIAITNDQTEPLLLSIFWHRLLNVDIPDPMEAIAPLPALPWKVLREALMHFPKILCNASRSLHHSELLHVQCMLLFPRFIKCHSEEQLNSMERLLFGNESEEREGIGHLERIRNRLLEEEIDPELFIEKDEVFVTRCVSLLDMQTELKHTLWQWIFKATEMIMDVGHKLCPPPLLERKGSKTKRQLAASDDYLTMATLFKRGILSFSSAHRTCQLLGDLCADATTSTNTQKKAMIVRFCDENAGALSLAFANGEEKPIFGSVTADQIKDFKQGLPEVLIDESFPSKFENIILLDFPPSVEFGISIRKKSTIFHYYRTQRQPAKGILVRDEETVRVNPLTGEVLPRRSTPSPEAESRDEDLENHPMSVPPNLFTLMQQLTAPSLGSPLLPLASPIVPSPIPLLSSTAITRSVLPPPINLFNQLAPNQRALEIFLKTFSGLQNANTTQLQDFDFDETDVTPAKRSPK